MSKTKQAPQQTAMAQALGKALPAPAAPIEKNSSVVRLLDSIAAQGTKIIDTMRDCATLVAQQFTKGSTADRINQFDALYKAELVKIDKNLRALLKACLLLRFEADRPVEVKNDKGEPAQVNAGSLVKQRDIVAAAKQVRAALGMAGSNNKGAKTDTPPASSAPAAPVVDSKGNPNAQGIIAHLPGILGDDGARSALFAALSSAGWSVMRADDARELWNLKAKVTAARDAATKATTEADRYAAWFALEPTLASIPAETPKADDVQNQTAPAKAKA